MSTKHQLLFLISFLILPLFSFSATYTTINSGDWSNTTNVWSLDGVNPCGCAPSIPTNGDNIIINHNITSNLSITIANGSALTVSAGASLSGGFVLSIENSVAVMNGNVSVTKLEIDANSEVDFNTSVLTVSSQMDIHGTVNVDGGYLLMTGGNITINSGAVFNTTNSGKVDIQNGNISNYGEFNLCSTCCFTTSGNWRNFSSGQVLGSGAATSTSGNMSNQGYWSPFVAWCSAGNASGMPGFENCLGANVICNLVILPVEMGEITASLNASGSPVIDWFTVSENNNSHFNILRFTSSNEWEVIGSVHGAGSTTERQDYTFTDYTAQNGINYYTIEQVDFDGQSSRSEVVSVKKSLDVFTIFPNPVSQSRNVTLAFDANSPTTIDILNATGGIVYSETTDKASIEINLQNLSIEKGMYFVSIRDNQTQHSQKLIVQ
ncbi:MAG: hypothetical protein CSA03_02360 [Bacteroidetes bacterium]|nr:MAG: hypothetical protein CSA03_02360 [Bacteroidota bacterium]